MGLSRLRIGLWIYRASFAIIVLLLVTILFGNAWAADAAPSPTFTLVGAALKLENGASEGNATMLLKADGLEKSAMEDTNAPEIIDQEVPAPPPVIVKFSAKEMQAGASSRSWFLSVKVNGLPPNTSQKRYLLVKFAGIERTLEYTLTNKYDTAFSWTLKPPPALSIRSGEAIEIGIAVGPIPASEVKLLQANLIEQSRKYPLASGGLMLCKNPTGRCESGINLLPNSANRLWLRTENNSYPIGQFVGSVTIAASQKHEGDTLNLTVYSTGFWPQFSGVLVILASVLISLGVLTYGRYRLNRDQLLLPVYFIIQKLRDLQKILAQRPDPIPSVATTKTSTKIGDLLGQLSEENLEKNGYIPPGHLPVSGGTAPKVDEFRQFLKKMDDWAWVLDLIISQGMAAAWSHLKKESSDDAVKAIIQTVMNLDKQSDLENVPSSNEVKNTMEKELQDLKNKLERVAIPPRAEAHPLERVTLPERSYEQLQLESRYISYAVWFVLALLTSLVGSYIIVFTNLAFGLWTDYLLCVFWGFGIPTGGQQLTQLTSPTLANTLGIPITKS